MIRLKIWEMATPASQHENLITKSESCGLNRDCLKTLLGPYQTKPVGYSFCRVCDTQRQDRVHVQLHLPRAAASSADSTSHLAVEGSLKTDKKVRDKKKSSVQRDVKSATKRVFTGINSLTGEEGSWVYEKEWTECSICMMFLDGLPYRSKCCGRSFCQCCTDYYKHLQSSFTFLHCPHCKSKKFTLAANEWLGNYLLANKTAISTAMNEYSIKSEEIPDERFPDTNKLWEASRSLRYFWVRGPAIHIGQKPCNHTWLSNRDHCILDLRNQCIIYSSPKSCKTCKIRPKAMFKVDGLVQMARFATELHIRFSKKRRARPPRTEQLKLQDLDSMIIFILTGALSSVSYAHWIHHTNHTMYGHNYWRS